MKKLPSRPPPRLRVTGTSSGVPARSHEGRRILVVEDNDDLRHLFSTHLKLAGFVVEVAADGIAALQHVDHSPPDLIVLDLGLPLLRGEDVAADLASVANTRAIPVVVVTGLPISTAPARAACVLSKPVQMTTLLETVRRCLIKAAAVEAVGGAILDGQPPRG